MIVLSFSGCSDSVVGIDSLPVEEEKALDLNPEYSGKDFFPIEVGNIWFFRDEYHVWDASTRTKRRHYTSIIKLTAISQYDDLDRDGCVKARYFEFKEEVDTSIQRWGAEYIRETNSYESYSLETLTEADSALVVLREIERGTSIFYSEGRSIILSKLEDFYYRMRWVEEDNSTLTNSIRDGASPDTFTLEENIGLTRGNRSVNTALGYWSNGWTRLDSLQLGVHPTTKLVGCR